MADVVLNSLGVGMWDNSFACVGMNGRWVTFGGLTGAEVNLNVQSLYTKQIKLISSTGGTRKDMYELIANSKGLKVKVLNRFRLENVKEALQSLFASDRDVRIILEVT
jgi:D-arabinose 1-dehydrogenase-like Zn-dependent alcohol dehydrogenase